MLTTTFTIVSTELASWPLKWQPSATKTVAALLGNVKAEPQTALLESFFKISENHLLYLYLKL